MHLEPGSAQWRYVSGDTLPCLSHDPISTQSIHQNETHSRENRASLHNMSFPLLSCVRPVVKHSAVFTLKLSSGFRVNIPLRLPGRFVLLSEKFKAVCSLGQRALNGSLLARYRNVIFVTTRQLFFQHKRHKLARSDPRLWTSGLEEPMGFMEAKMNFKRVSSAGFLCWMAPTSSRAGTFSTHAHVKLAFEPSFSNQF